MGLRVAVDWRLDGVVAVIVVPRACEGLLLGLVYGVGVGDWIVMIVVIVVVVLDWVVVGVVVGSPCAGSSESIPLRGDFFVILTAVAVLWVVGMIAPGWAGVMACWCWVGVFAVGGGGVFVFGRTVPISARVFIDIVVAVIVVPSGTGRIVVVPSGTGSIVVVPICTGISVVVVPAQVTISVAVEISSLTTVSIS